MYGEPAVYYDGLVASTNLYFDDIINHISHSLNVSTAAIRCPVSDVELTHLLSLLRLRSMYEVHVYSMGVGWSMIGGNLP